jgi:RsiW-degrading membrane proteinase PrsW (M82 family)
MFIFAILLAFIGLALGLAVYFVSQDRGEREPIGALWMAFGFGVLGAVIAGILELILIPTKALDPGSRPLTLFVSAMGVGVIEESSKFIPLALIIYGRRYFNEHTDGIIYFAIAGLGFGLPENILYTLQFGGAVGIERLILTPFFHAATTGMVGYFLIKGKLAHRKAIRVVPWLIVAMVIHGLYDFCSLSSPVALKLLSVLITFSMSALLFVLYSRATDLDKRFGLSVVGNNSFCRTCGYPNPKHRLYCARCGNHA